MRLVCVCYSENYIFGKFDTFTKRLEKIIKLVEIIDKSQGVENLRIEGIEEIVEQYKDIVEGLKKKNYDLLDFRRHEVPLYCCHICTSTHLFVHKFINFSVHLNPCRVSGTLFNDVRQEYYLLLHRSPGLTVLLLLQYCT